jgi:hypothetical protein
MKCFGFTLKFGKFLVIKLSLGSNGPSHWMGYAKWFGLSFESTTSAGIS